MACKPYRCKDCFLSFFVFSPKKGREVEGESYSLEVFQSFSKGSVGG